ncbi:MAG TPA: hypothetical protein VIS06_21255 [Mycobacteriales bacterium]
MADQTTTEPKEEDLYGCGYEWDHTARDLGDGHWECTECGAEGWDDPDDRG